MDNGAFMDQYSRSKPYKFTPQELKIARGELLATRKSADRLRVFLKETDHMAGDAIALQRASALKTIHHLEAQVADWLKQYPHLE